MALTRIPENESSCSLWTLNNTAPAKTKPNIGKSQALMNPRAPKINPIQISCGALFITALTYAVNTFRSGKLTIKNRLGITVLGLKIKFVTNPKNSVTKGRDKKCGWRSPSNLGNTGNY